MKSKARAAGIASDSAGFPQDACTNYDTNSVELIGKCNKLLYSYLKRLKLRLQFTGWLQYIPTAILTLAFFLVAALARLLGHMPVAYPFVFVGALLLTVLMFDLVHCEVSSASS